MHGGMILEHKTVTRDQINLMPYVVPGIPEVTYSCHTSPSDRNGGILTRDGALLLLKLYPLILWNQKNYCILGRRILHLAAPSLKNGDEFEVGFLSKASEEEVIRLMTLEPLLNQIAFATPAGGKGIFETSRLMDKGLVASASPPLTQSVEAISKILVDCSISTLFKLNSQFT
jgi:hypothetical protein